jgi:LysM repeat protein
MESQNKNLKSIFLNFLLLLAFIFSVMALYISLSFSEKMSTQKVETTEDELILEVQELFEAIAVVEKKVTDQANSLKTIQKNLTQMEKTSVKNQLKVVNKEPVKPKEGSLSSARYHVIQSEDTFFKVSKIYGVSLNALMNANKDLNPKALRVGQEIVIP